MDDELEIATGQQELAEIDELPVAADTAELEILHPTKRTPTGWVWTIAGPGHPKTIASGEKFGEKDRSATFHRERAYFTAREPKKTTNAAIIEDFAERQAARVLGWNAPCPISSHKGLPYSPKNVLTLLVDPHIGWLYTQVTEFLREESSFLPQSKTT